MSQSKGINDFHQGKFNPDTLPRHEYIEGIIFAMAQALGEYDADHCTDFDDGMEWIAHFANHSVLEILTRAC